METVILRILADNLVVLDTGNLAAIVLLNLLVAFDADDHRISTPALADNIWAARYCR
jgi:hypothetical protein